MLTDSLWQTFYVYFCALMIFQRLLCLLVFFIHLIQAFNHLFLIFLIKRRILILAILQKYFILFRRIQFRHKSFPTMGPQGLYSQPKNFLAHGSSLGLPPVSICIYNTKHFKFPERNYEDFWSQPTHLSKLTRLAQFVRHLTFTESASSLLLVGPLVQVTDEIKIWLFDFVHKSQYIENGSSVLLVHPPVQVDQAGWAVI